MNRRFAELLAPDIFVPGFLDSAEIAPFFAKQTALSEKICRCFAEQDLILSYLSDPEKIFENNVRSCSRAQFIRGAFNFDDSVHATEQLARPLIARGITILDFVPKLSFSETRPKGEIITIHPGSGSPRKNWPIKHWIELIDNIVARSRSVVVIGGEADHEQTAAIQVHFAERIRYAVDLPLRELAALLAGAIFIGHDTGVSHLAAASGARCLILFGPTDPLVWAPRGQNVQILLAPNQDLNLLSVETVRDAVMNL